MYSEGRLLALRDEWKLTYPGISEVLGKLRGCSGPMQVGEFVSILEEMSLLTADPEFPGSQWLTKATAGVWDSSVTDPWHVTYGPLIKVLYALGVLGFSTDASKAPKFSGDDPTLVERRSRMGTCTGVYVHRMLHLALDVQQIHERRDKFSMSDN